MRDESQSPSWVRHPLPARPEHARLTSYKGPENQHMKVFQSIRHTCGEFPIATIKCRDNARVSSRATVSLYDNIMVVNNFPG